MSNADGRVRCQACQREILASAAVTAEGRDYIWHFCGLDCYERWKQERPLDDTLSDQLADSGKN